MEITFASIQPLIVEEKWSGNQVSIKFKATNQEQPMLTMGVAMPNQDEMMKKMAAEMAKSAASNMAINAGANALGNLAGVSGLGSVTSSAASQAGLGYQMDASKLMEVEITETVRQETILNAFKGLAAFYRFENDQWIYKAI
ncbi:MAG: hypothetical protein CVU05_10480 [Bacteroidetes bacterium HGW-Bacteroidetes-21]|jgi:hypothetical protein|nr:MAG: hypothetical protein CVU05_10480 [Bacteroidetes bacterium HGW-Bacteroidetes-21]